MRVRVARHKNGHIAAFAVPFGRHWEARWVVRLDTDEPQLSVRGCSTHPFETPVVALRRAIEEGMKALDSLAPP